ncbi:MAG: DUF2793 domain-containing protein [Planctomycetota bacterium JB042]
MAHVIGATSPLIGWPTYVDGDVPAAVTLNQIDIDQDLFIRGTLLSVDLSAAPGSPADGDAYFVNGTPSPGDDWENHDNEIAYYVGGWKFYVPRNGDRFWLLDTANDYREQVWYYTKSSNHYWMRPNASNSIAVSNGGNGPVPVGLDQSGNIVREVTVVRALGTAGTYSQAHGATSINLAASALLGIKDFVVTNGTTAAFGPVVGSLASVTAVAPHVDATNVVFTVTGNFTGFTARATIRYTRSTGL